MRLRILVCACWMWVAAAGAADAVRSAGTAGFATTNLIIYCTNGAEVSQSAGRAVYHGGVQVLEAQMYLECDLLTLLADTNSPSPVRERGLTNLSERISVIIAETNLLIMTRDTTILGDRAVYTASNDLVTVTGDLVILETDRSYTFCTNFVVNRSSSQGYVLGWSSSVFRSKPGADGTNAGPPALGLPRPRKPGAGATRPAPRPGGTP